MDETAEGWSDDRIATKHGTLTEFVDGYVPPDGLTDDTEQALHVARGLVKCGKRDIMRSEAQVCPNALFDVRYSPAGWSQIQ
ncbi:hypothetical protein [Haloplanus pelagicus]|uniref:hypothetical protein n=1 Tax=Haloplanus pelagicus TaxID=2949995 RepID=UPI003CE5C619